MWKLLQVLLITGRTGQIEVGQHTHDLFDWVLRLQNTQSRNIAAFAKDYMLSRVR